MRPEKRSPLPRVTWLNGDQGLNVLLAKWWVGRDADQCWAQVWLLEMNSNPALHTNCEVLKEVIPGVVMETLGEALGQPPDLAICPPTACLVLDAPSHPLPKFRRPQT